MSAMVDRTGHLVRRLVGSISRRPPSVDDELWVERLLLAPEMRLWRSMSAADRRHSITVARRFEEVRPDPSRAEMAGALLHDIGKVDSGLGTVSRVVATLVGPIGRRFRLYHDHERVGADRLAAVGSDPVTVALVRGEGTAASSLLVADNL